VRNDSGVSRKNLGKIAPGFHQFHLTAQKDAYFRAGVRIQCGLLATYLTRISTTVETTGVNQ